MPYNIPGETEEQTQKMEKCVSDVIKSNYMKKYKDDKNRKSHAIAVCKSSVMKTSMSKDNTELETLRQELAKLRKSELSAEDKDTMRRKLISAVKKFGMAQYSAGEKKMKKELTEEELKLTDEEMEKIEKELGIDGIEIKDEIVEEKKDDVIASPEVIDSTKVVTSEVQNDIVAEPVKEVVADTSVVDVPAENIVKSVEQPIISIVAPVETSTALSKELIIEIKDALSKAYTDIKDKSDTVLKMQKEYNELKVKYDEIEKKCISFESEKLQLSKDLNVYVQKEEEKRRGEFEKRIQLLSDDYRLLGQNKDIETLKKLSIETITELEDVVRISLQSQSDSVLTPSQSMGVEKIAKRNTEEEKKMTLSKADSKTFFKHIGETLETGRKSGKRIIDL